MAEQLSVDALSVLQKAIQWTRCTDSDRGYILSDDAQMFLMEFDPRANSAQIMRLCRVSSQQRPVERAICKALFIYHANLLNWTCRCSGYQRVVQELAEELRVWESRETWAGDLWIWLSLLTANAARRSTLYQLQMQVMARLMALDSRAYDWESTLKVLQRFLLNSKLKREWKLCWDSAKALTAGPAGGAGPGIQLP